MSEPDPEEEEDEIRGEAPLDEADQLTAEEQMARYEEALKEEDWGHQPC